MAEFNLDKTLKAISAAYTPEMRAEFEAEQAKFRAQLHTAADRNALLRNQQIETQLRTALGYLAGQPDSELKTNRINQTLNRLAEILAEQGRFAEAIGICPDSMRRSHYQSLHEAHARPDDEICQCPSEQIADPVADVIRVIPSEHPMRNVFINGEKKTLYQCRQCGLRNIK